MSERAGAMWYPQSLPVFEVGRLDECIKGCEEAPFNGRIVVGVGIIGSGTMNVITVDGPRYALDVEDSYHYSWLRPLTQAARDMIEIAEEASRDY